MTKVSGMALLAHPVTAIQEFRVLLWESLWMKFIPSGCMVASLEIHSVSSCWSFSSASGNGMLPST